MKRSFSGRRPGTGGACICENGLREVEDKFDEGFLGSPRRNLSTWDVPIGRELDVAEREDDDKGRSWNSLYRFLSLSRGRAPRFIPCR